MHHATRRLGHTILHIGRSGAVELVPHSRIPALSLQRDLMVLPAKLQPRTGPELSSAAAKRSRTMPRLLAKLSHPSRQVFRQPMNRFSAARSTCLPPPGWNPPYWTPIAAQTGLTRGTGDAASRQQRQLLTMLLQPRHRLSNRCHAPVSSSAVDRAGAGKTAVEGETASAGQSRGGEQQENTEVNVSTGDQPGQEGRRDDNSKALNDAGGLLQSALRMPSANLEPAEIQKMMGVLVTNWRMRVASFTRESVLLTFSALIDNTLVVVLEWLQVDKLLRKATPWLERSSARIFGSWHELADGRRVPLSLVNNTSPDFSVPNGKYNPAELPFGQPRSAGYDPCIAHFMGLCMKVVYEEPEVMQDMAERYWGLQFHGYFATQTEAGSLYDIENKNTADFIPRTRACMLSSRHGIVITFRGSEPLNLINLRSSGKITMRPRFAMGRVHDGFHAGIFYSDPETGSLYTQLVETLSSVDPSRQLPIFLTGHSLGGALAVVFAAALASRHPDLAARVAGMYTFGMPRVGDSGFCSNMEAKFPGAAFRITHAADIIPLVPPRFLEYGHFGEERYITSLGAEVCGSEAISRARQIETVGFLPLYLWKLVAGLLFNPKEAAPRTVYRLAMLVSFPGLNDHFPADYTYKLGRLLK